MVNLCAIGAHCYGGKHRWGSMVVSVRMFPPSCTFGISVLCEIFASNFGSVFHTELLFVLTTDYVSLYLLACFLPSEKMLTQDGEHLALFGRALRRSRYGCQEELAFHSPARQHGSRPRISLRNCSRGDFCPSDLTYLTRPLHLIPASFQLKPSIQQ